MKSTGFVRKIDGLGRVVLPKELREKFNMEVNAPIEISVERESVILGRYKEKCILCREEKEKDLLNFKWKLICKKCVKNIKEYKY